MKGFLSSPCETPLLCQTAPPLHPLPDFGVLCSPQSLLLAPCYYGAPNGHRSLPAKIVKYSVANVNKPGGALNLMR